MGKTPAPLDELLLQISVEEGERYDEDYRSWQEGFDLSDEEDGAAPETVPESTPTPVVAVRSPGVEAGGNRVIGENDRRRVERGQVSSKPAKRAYREKGSGFN